MKVARGLEDMGAKNKLAGTLQDQYNQNKAQLDTALAKINSQYGEGSPEALAMKQRMERLDAKAGRNSQYGARETNLAASLADIRSRNALQGQSLAAQMAPGQAQLAGQSSALRAGANSGMYQTVGDLASMFR
jgi:hypothetical protein